MTDTSKTAKIRFGAKFSTLGGEVRGLNINFEFRFPKRFDPYVRPRCPSHRA